MRVRDKFRSRPLRASARVVTRTFMAASSGAATRWIAPAVTPPATGRPRCSTTKRSPPSRFAGRTKTSHAGCAIKLSKAPPGVPSRCTKERLGNAPLVIGENLTKGCLICHRELFSHRLLFHNVRFTRDRRIFPHSCGVPVGNQHYRVAAELLRDFINEK